MLKNIPEILTPELLKILDEMGHGDEIVLADCNFPAASHANKLITYRGVGIMPILEGILQLFPLDTYVPTPAKVMQPVSPDEGIPEIWNNFSTCINKFHPEFKEFEQIERFDFYDHARKAYAIVSTAEKTGYANLILKKGGV
ncbi:MAG: RbsD/FucU family protein [Cyclobacteriaceae bacterium]